MNLLNFGKLFMSAIPNRRIEVPSIVTDWEIVTPKAYGPFHLICFALTIIISICLAIYGVKLRENPERNQKVTRYIVFGFGIMLLVIEIYKQWFYTLLNGGDYQWYAFPFQFCSVPMYACLISFFVKNEKVRQSIYRFLAFFGLAAGLSVMFYPGDVFISKLTICIHTMLWHGSMVIVGAFLITSQGYGQSFKKEVPSGAITFSCFVMLALILDIVMYKTLFAEGRKFAGNTYNMFFISPYYPCTLPILSIIKEKVPYLIFLLSYLVAFSLASSLVWGVCCLVRLSVRSIKARNETQENKKLASQN